MSSVLTCLHCIASSAAKLRPKSTGAVVASISDEDEDEANICVTSDEGNEDCVQYGEDVGSGAELLLPPLEIKPLYVLSK